MCTQPSTTGSHASNVHETESSQVGAPPPMQPPDPSQLSLAVQNAPSSHAVPAGAAWAPQTKLTQRSAVQGSESAHCASAVHSGTNPAQIPPRH